VTTTVHLLCAGAAKGVVAALRSAFAADAGAEIAGEFGAVGAMRAKLLAGESCDVVVLTAAMIGELAAQRHVLADTVAPLGRVETGIAVRAGDPVPDVGDGLALRRALVAATAIYLPDPERATAGIHFVEVLRRLGVIDTLRERLRACPNGAAAMRELAPKGQAGSLGCTQVSEILYTPGVTLVGALPGEFALSTLYSVAVCSGARAPEPARRVAALLAGSQSAAVRSAGGFVV
jgi:molybdate transport system substrate-binding protein